MKTMSRGDLEFFKKPLLVVLSTFLIFLILFSFLEYLLTEKLMLSPYLSQNFKNGLFFGAFIFSLALFYFFYRKKVSWRPVLLAIVLFPGVIYAYGLYTKYYFSLQQGPKIYKINPQCNCDDESCWGIQGMIIEIEGKNFGPAWKPGKVMVDDLEFVVKEWSEGKIIAEQPVPEKTFKGQLFILDAQNQPSNTRSFIIRDPAELQG